MTDLLASLVSFETTKGLVHLVYRPLRAILSILYMTVAGTTDGKDR